VNVFQLLESKVGIFAIGILLIEVLCPLSQGRILALTIHMGYWPSVKSKWLDIAWSSSLFACSWTEMVSRFINSTHKKKKEANI